MIDISYEKYHWLFDAMRERGWHLTLATDDNYNSVEIRVYGGYLRYYIIIPSDYVGDILTQWQEELLPNEQKT